MSGHSKWSTIKRKKAVNDAKRSRHWTRLSKEVTVAARMGGGDPDNNPRLRLSIQNARAGNMPKETITRAIKKGTGEFGAAQYEELTYEGYGPQGVAVLVEALTDNVNRTVAEVRSIFNKRHGKLGEQGSVAWMFKQRGVVGVLKGDRDYDAAVDLALEAGAEDVHDADDQWLLVTAREDLYGVAGELESAGCEIQEAKLAQFPDMQIDISDEEIARKLLNLIDGLEDCDDVQNVYANFEFSEDLLAVLAE